MPRTPNESARDAIELMTAWSDAPDGPPDLLVDCLRSHIERRPDRERLAAAVELIMGMTQLCGSLLAIAEEAAGVSPRRLLQELALHYAVD